jgi:hypothetical protein
MKRPTALAPDVVRFVPQNGRDADCGIAAAAMLFGLSRDEAVACCAAVRPQVLSHGLQMVNLVEIARILGSRHARWVPKGHYDLHEDTGVLYVQDATQGHVALLWEGRIVDGSGEMWLDPEDYLLHYQFTVGALLVRE